MPHPLNLLRKIPKGKIITYKILAKKLGVHPRYAGYLLKTNQCPERYPCYKVVKSNGKIGKYNGPGGMAKKIELLKKDGIKIKEEKILNFNKTLLQGNDNVLV